MREQPLARSQTAGVVAKAAELRVSRLLGYSLEERLAVAAEVAGRSRIPRWAVADGGGRGGRGWRWVVGGQREPPAVGRGAEDGQPARGRRGYHHSIRLVQKPD